MGEVSLADWRQERAREIFFSAILQERVGHHFFGEKWANKVKEVLVDNNLQKTFAYHQCQYAQC